MLRSGRPPWLGPAAGSDVQGETVALVGPITPKAECNSTEWKQQIKYPCYRIKDTQSLKNKQLNVMYNNPRLGEQ